MTQDRRQVLPENLIYLIIWMLLFAAPVLGYKYGTDTSAVVWNDVFRSWKMLAPFVVLFLVNNYLLIPYFLLRKKSRLYLLFVLILTGLVFLMNPLPMMKRFVWNNRQHPEHTDLRNPSGQRGEQPPFRHGNFPSRPEQPGSSEPKPLSRPDPSDYLPPHASRPEDMRHPGINELPPGTGIRRTPARYDPYFFFMSPLFKFLMTAALTIGLNVAVKLMFRLTREGQRVRELEKQRLRDELEYLKHQINPHFFMNTLNNIHALIDIDAEKAKETILDLSKMMRYVLYDTEQSKLSLEKEIRFLKNYVGLMKLRYTDQVEISINIPEEIPDVQVPPLLFISFLENAFKHGVSYRHRSFIRFSVYVTGPKLECEIENSKSENRNTHPESGIGLENVKKRLRLLYKEDCKLTICDEKEKFKVLLIIPV